MERRKRGRGVLARALVAGAALSAALVTSSPAAAEAGAQKGCWREVVSDWSNGGVDHGHSLGCYRAALNNLPNDIRTYTTAEEDIRRALLNEIRRHSSTGESRSTSA